MNIFVTGAAGFIGSHVCEYFIGRNHTVTGIDNFDDFYPERYKRLNISKLKVNESFKIYEGDIRNSELLNEIFSENNLDVVIHLAAKAGVRPSIESIAEYYDVNVNGTISLLETMKLHGVKKMLFASSSSVYGNNKKVPFSEFDAVDNPISPYASTKKSGELLCHVYSHLHAFDITCLRFFTVYGPRQRPDLAIHKFTRLIDEEKPVTIYGDGNTSRDYTYIDDIVDGIGCAFEHLGGYRIYNLGESNVVSLKKMLSVIERHVGKQAIIKQLAMQPGDVQTTYADITKAKKEINYNPRVHFDDGIQKFWEWYQIILKYCNYSTPTNM